MATRIPQRELRNNNADILSRVAAGETFVVTRNGVPVADVTPHVAQATPPVFARTTDLLAWQRARGGPEVDAQAWLADIRGAGVIDDDPFGSRA